MERYSFVVQVHPDGVSTLENLATRERVKIEGLEEVGPRIEGWLEELEAMKLPQSPLPVPSGQGSPAGSDSRSGQAERD